MAHCQRASRVSGLEARFATSTFGLYSHFHNLTYIEYHFHRPSGQFGNASEGQGDVAQQVCSSSFLLFEGGIACHHSLNYTCFKFRDILWQLLRLVPFQLLYCRVVSCTHAAVATALGLYWFLGTEEPEKIGDRPFVFLPFNAHIEAFGVGYFVYDFFAMLALRQYMSAGFFWGIMAHHIIFILAYLSTLVRSVLAARHPRLCLACSSCTMHARSSHPDVPLCRGNKQNTIIYYGNTTPCFIEPHVG
jgi:hypothetical protein